MAYLSPAMIKLLHRAVRAPDGEGVPLHRYEHSTARALQDRNLGWHPHAGRFYATSTLRELVAAVRRGDV
jgi:hypothetical protein